MNPLLSFDELIGNIGMSHGRKRVAVACPADSHTEYVIERCLKDNIADFTLVCAGGFTPETDRLYSQWQGRVNVVMTGTADEAARKAVAICRAGEADVLMKGSLNTDNLLHAVLDKTCGLLEQGRILSHVTVVQIPAYGKLLVFTDAAVIPSPTLEQFDAIVGYAAGVSRRLGVQRPGVALINYTEKVGEKFPRSIIYKELMRRAADGCYGDISIGGPMDVKTALDAESGRIKGISSPVVGNADVLIFPNIEAANVFYKTLTLFANAETAGMLCGTSVPVVVTSRADSCESKYYSLALACCN